MISRYEIVANEYFNAGGNNMVNISTVYDSQEKLLLFINIDEENVVVATRDIVREELPSKINAEDVIKTTIEMADYNIDDEHIDVELNTELLSIIDCCMLLYIQNKVAYTKRHYFVDVRQLPKSLRLTVTSDYIAWLEDHDEYIETDGYSIYKQPAYIDDKKQQLEQVLDLQLNDLMIEDLCIEWRSFYTRPTKYAGTIVVQMVRNYLEQQIYYAE